MRTKNDMFCVVSLADARRIQGLLLALANEFQEIMERRDQCEQFAADEILSRAVILETSLF